MKEQHNEWYHRRGKILVVDDQVFNIDTMKEMMSFIGIDTPEIEEAMNGEQAL